MFKAASKCRSTNPVALLHTRRAVAAHPGLLMVNTQMSIMYP